MPWNPELYNQFKSIRYQPFFDLVELIDDAGLQQCIDVGCGTGEQTSILAEKFSGAHFLGIDLSAEMLTGSEKFVHDTLQFRQSSIEAFAAGDSTWDLIFSNAALQWSDDHAALFPKIISRLNTDGQLAVQMPVQTENRLNKILLELATEAPYAGFLNHWKRESQVLGIDYYAQILFDAGLKNIQVIQKIYPIIADNEDQLFDFISGSALIPYLEKLQGNQQEMFIAAYKSRIKKAFYTFPAIYAFKRLLLYGKK